MGEETRAFWLLKTEPGSYGWDDLVRDGGTEWDGVRNAAAAGHLRAMRLGDRALLYHSGEARAAVGLIRVVRGPRPDGGDGKGDGESRWVSVRVEPEAPLAHPVTLAAMKADKRLSALAMLRQSRLSVSPVGEAEWAVLLDLGGVASLS